MKVLIAETGVDPAAPDDPSGPLHSMPVINAKVAVFAFVAAFAKQAGDHPPVRRSGRLP